MFFLRGASSKPASQRMYLTSNATVSSTSATKLTGWTADGSYPATNIVSSALTVDKAGTINITAQMDVSANSFGDTVTGAIFKNGSSIKSASTTTGNISLSISGVSVSASDTIAMYVSGTPFGTGDTIASGSANTFITIVSA